MLPYDATSSQPRIKSNLSGDAGETRDHREESRLGSDPFRLDGDGAA